VASGSAIAFAPGRFQPNTAPGRRLIAHELAHVLQAISARRRGVSLPRVLMSPDRIVNVQVNATSRTIVFRIDDGSKLVGTLNEDAELDPGIYTLNYSAAKGIPAAQGLPKFTGFTFENAEDHKRYKKLEKKISNVPMRVIAPRITSDEEGTGTGKKGTGVGGGTQQGTGGAGKQGAGTGQTGTGAGSKQGAGKTGTGGGGKQGTGGGGLTEAQKKARQFLAKIGGQTVPGVEVDEQRLGEQLAKLTPEELEELAKFITETASAEALDINSAVELFTSLTPEQREVLRANVALKAEGSLVTSPEQVTAAIRQDAQATQDVQKQADKLNESLAKIHNKVTDPKMKKNFEPIDLSKLKFFKEMMLLEGLLAGAASRSPEIGEIAKKLTTAIGEIRGWILDEIKWLAAEIAVGAIFSFLTAGATFGVSAAVTGARVALLVRRLNKLRQLIERIEGAYNTYQKITETFSKIKRASQAFKEFEKKYAELKSKIDKLKTSIDIEEFSETAPDDLEEAEDQLSDLIAEAIENDEVFGDILDNFYLPPDLKEEDLVQVLMDIPKGVEAFKEVMAYYSKAKSSDLQSVTVLALKGVRAGSYLYPFVGYLASIVEQRLSSLVQGGDFGSRLLGLLPKGGKVKGAGKKKNKESLKAAQRARKEKRKKEREQRRKEREKEKKEAAKQAKDKKEREKLAEAQWKQLKTEIEGLAAKYHPEGTTDIELKKELARLRSKYGGVMGRQSVKETKNPGRWAVEVHRKGKRGKVEVKVLMTVHMRQRVVQGKLRRKLDSLAADQRTRKKIISIAEEFKKPYGIDAIEVAEPAKDGEPFLIYGTFAGKKLEIGRTDVISDHHSGTKQDPIPIYWYKEKSDYPTSIQLIIDGKNKTVRMNDTSTFLRHDGQRVMVGVTAKNMVEKYKDLTRRVAAPRVREEQYYAALKAHGYDMATRTPRESPDHVTDLGMSGPDAFENLWPLDSKINAIGFGWTRDYQIEYIKDGQIQTTNLHNLIGKTFRVMGFDKKPKMPGGKGSNRAPAMKRRRK
jgi:hypothetical protein